MESSSLKLKGSSLKKKTHFFFIYNKRFDSTPSQSKSTSFAIYISHAHPSDDTNRETRRLATHSHCGHCSTCTPIYWFTTAAILLVDSFVVSILGGSVRNVTNALTNENVFCYLFVLLFSVMFCSVRSALLSSRFCYVLFCLHPSCALRSRTKT